MKCSGEVLELTGTLLEFPALYGSSVRLFVLYCTVLYCTVYLHKMPQRNIISIQCCLLVSGRHVGIISFHGDRNPRSIHQRRAC